MNEIWKPVKGFEGLYEVSTHGRVRSMPRNGTQSKTVHILIPSVARGGYCRYTLFKNNKPKYVSIHRLVAESFIEKPDGKVEVNHIDGNPSNNNVDNLEWVTRNENHLHRVYKLGHNPLKPCRKVVCVEANKQFKSIREASRFFGCDHKTINNALLGKYTTACGFHWEYANK